MAAQYDPAGSAGTLTPNPWSGRFEVITDARLDGQTSGTAAWYLFADPNDIAAFEVVFLDGVQTPFLDEMVDFDTDSMKFKVRLDYGIACGDWRAGYLNDGA